MESAGFSSKGHMGNYENRFLSDFISNCADWSGYGGIDLPGITDLGDCRDHRLDLRNLNNRRRDYEST
jgi:hypothetical protein